MRGTQAVETFSNSTPPDVVSIPPTSVVEWRSRQSRLPPHPEPLTIPQSPSEKSAQSSISDFSLSVASLQKLEWGRSSHDIYISSVSCISGRPAHSMGTFVFRKHLSLYYGWFTSIPRCSDTTRNRWVMMLCVSWPCQAFCPAGSSVGLASTQPSQLSLRWIHPCRSTRDRK